jgi:hypothetical protein
MLGFPLASRDIENQSRLLSSEVSCDCFLFPSNQEHRYDNR